MGTRVIIPNSDFSRNGMPFYKDMVFITNSDTTVNVLFNNSESVSISAIEDVPCGIDCPVPFTSAANILIDNTAIKEIVNINSENVNTFDSAFQGMTNLKKIPPFVVSNSCTVLDRILYGCRNLEYIDAKNWDLSRCTTFFYAFAVCQNIEHIDLSKKKIGGYAILTDSFRSCTKLKSVRMPKAELPYRIMEMFSNCTALEEIDFTQFDVPVTEQHAGLFGNCPSLTTMYCNSSNYQYFIARAADAGYSFSADNNYVLHKNT